MPQVDFKILKTKRNQVDFQPQAKNGYWGNTRRVITVMNGKGGSGKSTLLTNLAVYMANHAHVVTMLDYDPQESALKWLRARPPGLPMIGGVSMSRFFENSSLKTAFRAKIPTQTTDVLLDTPAGISGFFLDDVILQSNVIVIPVLPSAHDIRATAEFVGKLMLNSVYRRERIPIAVVANRVKHSSIAFLKLQRFLNQLHIPFVAAFSDNTYYLQAAERGMGFYELVTQSQENEIQEWTKLYQWIAEQNKR